MGVRIAPALYHNTVLNLGGSVMDIANLSMALAHISDMSQIGTAVLSKAMDTNEALGEGLVQMMDSAMELSVNPNVGANIDIRI